MINIARILSECPKNTKLYSPIFGDCTLVEVGTSMITVLCCASAIRYTFYSDGTYVKNGECMLFPSKEQRNWHKFHMPFKDGDIISNDKFVAIFYNFIDDHLFYHCWYNKQTGEFKAKIDFGIGYGYEYTYATEKEKTELFNIIKANGYEWNADTKTLEKLVEPKFKVGDYVVKKGGITVPVLITGVGSDYYYSNTENSVGLFSMKEQDEWELVPNKFDITTLKPFESKVLVRHNKGNKWTGSFFSFIDRDLQAHCYKFVTTADKSYPMMIPYKGNEYLLGKTEDCKDFYKTWK